MKHNMKYKLGDIVRVRPDLKEQHLYSNENGATAEVAVPEMLELCGQKLKIEKIVGLEKEYFYLIKGWLWTDEMLMECNKYEQ